MADVARVAGVSASTASRVIYNSGYVSEENRRRVEHAVAKVGYRPNMQARGLRNQRSYTLGLVTDSATNNAHFAHIAQAVRIEAAAAGYSLLTVDHEYDPTIERQGLTHLLEHNVEAIAVCHPFAIENYDMVKEANIPLIQIERRNLGDVHRVEIDPIPGFQEAVRHLVELGHRSIGYISGDSIGKAAPQSQMSVEFQRVKAFQSVVAEHDLQIEECPIKHVPYDLQGLDEDLHGYIFGKELLQAPSRPTALIVGADVLAAGILQAASDLGIAIPAAVSLVGFDDSIAKFLTPPLATIAQPHRQIAREALLIAARLSSEDATAPIRAVVATQFQPRRSTTAPFRS